MEVVRIMLKSRGQTPGQITVADQLVEQLISGYANINRGKIMLIGVNRFKHSAHKEFH